MTIIKLNDTTKNQFINDKRFFSVWVVIKFVDESEQYS